MDTADKQLQSDTVPSMQDMAGLMGLDLESDDPMSGGNNSQPSTDFDVSTKFNVEDDATMDQEPTIDAEFAPEDQHNDINDVFNEADFNPEKNRTKVSLQHNGLAKAALVGGVGLTVIVGGMTFFQGQMPKEQVAQVVKKKDPAEDKVSSAKAETTKAQQSESETKAQLALAKQKDSLAEAQQAGKIQDSSEKITASKTPIETAPPVVAAPITRAPIVATAPAISPAPQVVPQPKVVAPVKAPAAAPSGPQSPAKPAPVVVAPVKAIQPEIQLASSKSSGKSLLKATTIPGASISRQPAFDRAPAPAPVDPLLELQQLASIGRYGAVATSGSTPPPPALNPENRPTSLQGVSPVALAVSSNLPPLSQYFQSYANQDAGSNTNSKANSTNESRGARTAFANQQIISGQKSIDKEPQKESPKEPAKDLVAAKDNSTLTTSVAGSVAGLATDSVASLIAPLAPSAIGTKIAEAPLSITTLLVGTSAKGSTVTPVLWGSGTSSGAKFLLKLDEPMLDGNNREAFPAGTQFVVTAKQANSTIGIADLEIVSAIIKGMEFAPPNGSIVIRDDQGGLLIGEDYFKRDENTSNRDLLGVFAGALGNVGRILNQPSSTFSSNTNGGFGGSSSSVITNRDPNLLGAVLEGGFKDLSSVWSQRNQQAIQELAGRPNIYQIPKGRGIRVFINQSMTF
jgi:Bacterial conjugation TrbI-like protein